MQLQLIDRMTWDREPIFSHFIHTLRCVMSMTVEIDVTDFCKALRVKGYQFYPALLWAVSAAINSREEFRMCYNEAGEVGTWDFVSPYYAHFHKEDEKFVKLWTEYDSDFFTFHKRFLQDKVRYESCRGFDVTQIPPNTFDVSCLPWAHYSSFDLHVFDSGTYLAPVVTWGKYTADKHGRITLPLTMNIHHAVADGYHLCRFFSDVETQLGQVVAVLSF